MKSDDRLTILVLGVGGNVSQGILKALALSNLSCRVVGACINSHAVGLYTVDRCYVSPPARDDSFLDWLMDTCRIENVQVILSGVEPVLDVLAKHASLITQQTGSVPIVSPPDRLAIGSDKLKTCRWLQEHGFNFPRYADANDKYALSTLLSSCGFPLIAKPRIGKSGFGVHVIYDINDFAPFIGRDGYVIQEYLGNPQNEYTAGCFSDCTGNVRGVIVMRRELKAGTTIWAEAGLFPDIREEARRIAAALRPTGPCNIQLRMHDDHPVCFEINVRFSGTTPIRARLGFNDVEATLRHYILGDPPVTLPMVVNGIAIRYWNEIYIDPRANDALGKNGKLANPHSYSTHVETYGKSA